MAGTRTKVPSQFGKGAAYYGTHMNSLMKEIKPDNCILQGGLAKAQGTPNMTVAYPDMIVGIGASIIQVLGANTGNFTAATAGMQKMGILEVGVDGVVDIKYGVEAAANPVIPDASADHALICAVGPILQSTTTITNALIDNGKRDLSK